MRRRVVITGMGAVTPIGQSVAEFFRASVAGLNGVGPIRQFDASTFPVRIAAEVRGFDLSARFPGGLPPHAVRWGANTRFAAAAAQEALAQAGLSSRQPRSERHRFGVYIGVGEGTQNFHHLMWMVARSYSPETKRLDGRAFIGHGLRVLDADEEMEKELHTTVARLAAMFDLRGPNYSCLTSCAAGGQAIGEAALQIRYGDADVMLAGGTHSMIHPLGVSGFIRLTALSANPDPEQASRPFDRDRDGFVLGEGAGMLVLEELDHARRRGAAILAELTGYGCGADAFRVTDSHPEGRGAIACIRQALADAHLAPLDISYINAHGTSTKLNDAVESRAIRHVFGPAAPPVSSTKSMIGHLIAAAGAVELIACVEAIRHGILPPTIHYQAPDPECDLDYIPNFPRERRIRHALSNSFGFGGQNVSLIVRRFEG
jgi:3-oxoacyl-[acyl-carrier-protein] synthase II